jgi:MSHA biogenesis protein MshJ
MHEQWQAYSEKYLTLTIREQYLVLIIGIIVSFMVIFTGFVEDNLALVQTQNTKIIQLSAANKKTASSIVLLDKALLNDPNIAIKQQIDHYEKKLLNVDENLFKLTSDLIDPIQMRHALLALLNLQQGVKLVSFEVMPVEPILLTNTVDDEPTEAKDKAKIDDQSKALITPDLNDSVSLGLYRHSIRLKLTGRYFQLRDYLSQLEDLSWTFFWQRFHYQLLEYPMSELEVEIYSLSTDPEFIGV